ncbi:MAG TPA: hypothetical protein VGF94_17560 [Kofleriaceae bacterium]
MAAGCSSAIPEAPVTSSVRARLAVTTPLFVTAAASGGTITASRNTATGWQDGATALAVADGELDASADATGALDVSRFELELAPIDLPSDVLGQPAQLRDVRVALATESAMPATWSDDDDAAAAATVDLTLDWTLVVGGSAAPLGTQQLQGVLVAISLAGDGEPVTATIGATGSGELWSWADLVRLQGLQLTLQALSNP